MTDVPTVVMNVSDESIGEGRLAAELLDRMMSSGAMLRIRLEAVKRLLRDTNSSISEITRECGWENPTPPKALFRKRFGMSMREFRASTRGTTPAI